MKLLLGREPALWIALVGAVLTTLAGLGLPGLNPGQASALVAFLTAVLMAVTTRPVAPAVFTGLVSAAVALFLEYGVTVPEGVTAGLTAITLAALALFGVRPQVTPAPTVVSGR
jgi:hypothetical protein